MKSLLHAVACFQAVIVQQMDNAICFHGPDDIDFLIVTRKETTPRNRLFQDIGNVFTL